MAIRCLTASLAAALLLAGVRTSDAVVRIVEDRGGRIETYVDKYQAVRSSGEMVIIDGFCASACTIVLGAVAHDKICVTSRAKLGFHAAWDPGSNGRRISNPEATQTLYSMYPFEVQRWIDQRAWRDVIATCVGPRCAGCDIRVRSKTAGCRYLFASASRARSYEERNPSAPAKCNMSVCRM